MCTVLAWKGELPLGMLSQLLIAAQIRGRDSTGVAFRNEAEKKLTFFKAAQNARTFVKANRANMTLARKATAGVAHTRRASPGLPIDDDHAHPFVFEKFLYVHNGFIKNWRDLSAIDSHVDKLPRATSDSMVLGPRIELNDFSDVEGVFALAWIRKDEVTVLHAGKELEGVSVCWEQTVTEEDNTSTVARGQFSLAVSQLAIFDVAASAVKGLNYEAQKWSLDEGVRYALEIDGFEALDKPQINPVCFTLSDVASSAADSACQVEPDPEPTPGT